MFVHCPALPLQIVGQKLSIVSPKPQTTRHRIMGIASGTDYQASASSLNLALRTLCLSKPVEGGSQKVQKQALGPEGPAPQCVEIGALGSQLTREYTL